MLSKADMLLPSANRPIRSSYAKEEMELAVRRWLVSALSRLVRGVTLEPVKEVRVSRCFEGVVTRVGRFS